MTTEQITTSVQRVTPWRGARVTRRGALGAVGAGAAAVAILVFVLSTDAFLTVGNLKSIALLSGFAGIVALGQLMIMVSGNFFSLSLGTTLATSSIIFVWMLQIGVVPAILISIAFGALVSALQGFCVGAWSTNPIILTIAADSIMTAAVTLITGGNAETTGPHAPSLHFLAAPIGGVAFPFYVLVLLVIVTHLLLTRTRLGAYMTLAGENRAAARAASLPVTTAMVGAFALSGVLAAVAGILLAAFNNSSADLTIQGNLSFNAIAATLVGGAAITGGRGSAIGTFVGTLVMGAIQSCLLLRGYSDQVQLTVTGGIVFVAVIIVHLWSTRGIAHK